MEIESCLTESLPFVAMIAVEFVHIGLATLSKAAMASGLSQYVYIVYYDAFGTIILLPWIVFQSLSGKSLLINFSLLCRFFGLSLIGKCLFPICYYTGLSYSSITLGAAIENLTPIFTSVLAISLRMEKLDIRKSTDQIKALGMFVAVLGALTVTLYKGPVLLSDQQSNWPLGGLLLTLAVLLKSVQNIVQADVAKLYPDEVSLVFFYTLFGTIQTAAASFFMVKGQSEWQLNHKIQIIAVVYAAFSLSALTTTVITWCLRKRGPVYVSMFTPLNVAIAAVMGFVFLADNIYLGSVIGSGTTVIGFYAVMWGRAKTTTDVMVDNNIGCLDSAASNQQVTPLLQSSHI